MGVAEGRDADARHEVQILATVDVVQARARATHERHRLTPVRLEHVLGLFRLDLVEGRLHRITTWVVPSCACRAAASCSKSMLRPLMISTSPTPRFRAAVHAC